VKRVASSTVFAVASVYAGLALLALGLVSLLRPPRFLGIRSRRRAAALLACGPVLVAIGWSLPASDVSVQPPRSRLDAFLPTYQFNERHALHVKAGPDHVFRAIRSVTADEIFPFRTLTWLRRFGRPGPESILAAPERMPLIDVATRTSFLLLAEEPDREIVIGTLVLAPAGFRPRERPTPEEFRRLAEPGFAKAVMNFRVEPDGRGGSNVSTETRVFATDPASRRRFAPYWRTIYPGSALIRRTWLGVIRARSEGSGAGPSASRLRSEVRPSSSAIRSSDSLRSSGRKSVVFCMPYAIP
jgi:hypothetical protein